MIHKFFKIIRRDLIFLIRDKKTFFPLIAFSLKGYKFIAILSLVFIGFSYIVFFLFSSIEIFYSMTPLGRINIDDQQNRERLVLVDSLMRTLEMREKSLGALLEIIPDDIEVDASIFQQAEPIENFGPINPVKNGVISDVFDRQKKHYAIDIAAQKNAQIYPILDGYVVFAEKSDKTGNVVAIQHQNGWISIYKHCSKLLVKQGKKVTQKTVIAQVGDEGELNRGGAHLHLEIWSKGEPLNAEHLLDYN